MFKQNRKMLAIALSIAFALVLFAGCGDKSASPDIGDIESAAEDLTNVSIGNEAPDQDSPEQLQEYEWPTDAFPPGFPAYPDGSVVWIEYKEEGGCEVTIVGTNTNTIEAYRATLEGAGWKPDEILEEGGSFAHVFFKDTYMLILAFGKNGDAIEIHIDDIGFDYSAIDLKDLTEWPEELPEYPDGEIDYERSSVLDGSPCVIIIKSSKESFIKYVDILKGAGWEVNESALDKDMFKAKKGGRDIIADLDEDGTTVSLLLSADKGN